MTKILKTEEAIQILKDNKWKQFDGEIVDVFTEAVTLEKWQISELRYNRYFGFQPKNDRV